MRLFRSFGICMAFLILISSCAGPKLKKSESVIFCVEVAGVSYFADENGVMLFGRQFDDAYPFRERFARVRSMINGDSLIQKERWLSRVSMMPRGLSVRDLPV